jgi:hypothetical protein
MGAREEFRSTGKRSRVAASAVALVATAGVVGCGGDDDFANDPRPAAPIVVTAKVDDQKVVVSPSEFGAGLVNITVSNQSDDPVNLTLVGPAPEDNDESGDIPPGGVGNLKAEVVEGDYEVNGGERSDAKPAQITVGSARASSSDELLLP